MRAFLGFILIIAGILIFAFGVIQVIRAASAITTNSFYGLQPLIVIGALIALVGLLFIVAGFSSLSETESSSI